MHTVAAHGVQHHQSGLQVVGVVFDGLGNAFAHGLVGGELDHGVNVRILGKQSFHGLGVGEIHFHEAEILAGDLLDPLHSLGAGIVEVISYNDVVAGGQKFHAGVAADVTGAAAYQNCHCKHSHSFVVS